MLKIVNASGRTLHLPPDVVVTVERNNPLFNDPDKFLQDVSYSFTVPFSPNADLFFGFGRLVEKANDTYTMADISCYASGTTLIKGNIKYKVTASGYEANLQPNFAAINSLIKNIRLTEIRTEDAEYGFTQTTFEDRMLDTAMNPDKYPYIFFPVYNPDWYTASEIAHYDHVNHFDETTQRFVAGPPPGYPAAFNYAQTPFFKLTYILKQIALYLGLTPAGDFFTYPAANKRVIHTRYALGYLEIMPCMTYMPNMLLSDFLKQLQRDHMSIDPDLLTGEFRVTTFKNIKDSETVIDLTGFLASEGEQEVPTGQSLRVTLKSDQSDANYANTDVEGAVTYPPTSTLIAGTGDTDLELECGTTKTRINPNGVTEPWLSQSVINGLGGGGTAGDINYTDPNDFTTLNNWQLRLLNYEGYLPVAGGGHYPSATAHELNDADADWYRFLNDSKRIKPIFYLPANIVATLRLGVKFTHKTSSGNYVTYIAEQIAYDAGADADRIPVKITGRVISYSDRTKVTIVPYAPPVSDTAPSYNAGFIKAYFDPAIHGISDVKLEVFGYPGDTYSAGPITVPANIKGAGGKAVPVLWLTSAPYLDLAHAVPLEFRICQGQPKYVLHRGLRYNFAKVGGYYTVTLDMWGENQVHLPDFYTIFF